MKKYQITSVSVLSSSGTALLSSCCGIKSIGKKIKLALPQSLIQPLTKNKLLSKNIIAVWTVHPLSPVLLTISPWKSQSKLATNIQYFWQNSFTDRTLLRSKSVWNRILTYAKFPLKGGNPGLVLGLSSLGLIQIHSWLPVMISLFGIIAFLKFLNVVLKPSMKFSKLLLIF